MQSDDDDENYWQIVGKQHGEKKEIEKREEDDDDAPLGIPVPLEKQEEVEVPGTDGGVMKRVLVRAKELNERNEGTGRGNTEVDATEVKVVKPKSKVEAEFENIEKRLAKKEKNEGRRPPRGSLVSVHFVGTFAKDGYEFDSSRDRNKGEPSVFYIGTGQVIRGWDVGVATMKPGEKARFTCRASYAYGPKGVEGRIPKNATLIFEIELISWTMEDLYNGSHMKRLKLRVGTGANAHYESVCRVDVAVLPGLTHETDGEDVDNLPTPLHVKTGWDVVLGETAGLPVGLERALEKMCNGEEGLFTVDGSLVDSDDAEWQITKGTTFRYLVSLAISVNHEDEDSYESEAKVQQAAMRKEQGNTYFSEKNWRGAELKYKRALDFLYGWAAGQDDELRPQARQLELAIRGNLAQTMLNRGDNLSLRGCLDECDMAEDMTHPGDVARNKALFRRAKAFTLLHDYDGALADLNAILVTNPEITHVQAELKRVNKIINDHKVGEKKKFSKLFA